MESPRRARKLLFRHLAELTTIVARRLPGDCLVDALTLVAPLPLLIAQRQRFAFLAPWLLASCDDWSRPVLEEIFAATGIVPGAARGWLRSDEVAALTKEDNSIAAVARDPHYFEELLKACDAADRRRRGVFFTPPPLARYLVRETDRLLQEERGLESGLADEAFVRILDPAAGTGLFLLAALDRIHSRLHERWQSRGLTEVEQADAWNDYLPRLLPRLAGIELLPAPCLVARLQLALRLAELEYRFESSGRIRIELGNALAGPEDSAAGQLLAEPFTVLLGNPPFSGVSENKQPWIERLVDGDAASGVRGYFEIDSQPLGERKHWLKDDYVKFLRLAQWRIEESGGGIVGFVTNHGYLDNATFRGMRQQLAQTFSRITIVDLHGNRKKHEVSPDGSRDENAFGIDQGVALGLFRRTANSKPGQTIAFSELWGSRDDKFQQLEAGLQSAAVSLTGPHYRFVPSVVANHPEYASAIKLTDLLPLNVTAPVTARDAFVVAFTQAELLDRLAAFRDPSIPDDEIRRRYFTSTRSRKYAAGDTRGWNLSEVRRQFAADDHWQASIRRCLYRPFDWRWIAWDARLIDWPRSEITQHLLGKDAVALITRRQQLSHKPCTFFWVADGLALDGAIRSDNKGSESLFVASQTGSVPRGYLYALFHSATYRTRYAHELQHDFPHVPLPRDPSLMAALAPLGERLIDVHCLRGVTVHPGVSELLAGQVVGPRYPKYEAGAIHVSECAALRGIPESIWTFLAGGHQPCKKWLADRRGRKLSPDDGEHYGKILAAQAATLEIVPQIDAAIDAFGGFPTAFQCSMPP